MTSSPALQEPTIRLTEPVRNLLSNKGPAIWSIAPEATVLSAIELMAEKRVGCLVVLSGGYLAGVVSERDYARKVILKGRDSLETHVRDIMSSPVLFVKPQQTIEESMRLMSTRQVHYLPVLEGDTVVGMLSIGDVVNWIVNAQQHAAR